MSHLLLARRAENVRFRPGMRHPVVVSSDNNGRDLVDADGIRSVAKELARLASGSGLLPKI